MKVWGHKIGAAHAARLQKSGSYNSQNAAQRESSIRTSLLVFKLSVFPFVTQVSCRIVKSLDYHPDDITVTSLGLFS